MAKRGRKKTVVHSHDLLSMALQGYESAKAKIEESIAAIQKQLGAAARSAKKVGSAALEKVAPTGKRRKLSGKARKAISMAQKKRWSEARAAKKASSNGGKEKSAKATKRKPQQKTNRKTVKVVGELAPF